MRGLALVTAVLLLAGCSDSGGGAGPSTTSTSTTAAPGNGTTLPPTTAGLPLVSLDDDKDLIVSLSGDNAVHRLRVVAFDEFTVESVPTPGQGGGGFGGGGGGTSNFGLALFAADADPARQPPCSEAIEFPAWDGRVRSGSAEFAGSAGVYDLWLWSGGPDTVTLEVNGGGDERNVTATAHNWTAQVLEPTVTKSGPAQTTADFDEVIPVAASALILSRYVPPNGYPQETMDLLVQSGGATCGQGVVVTSGFGTFTTQSLLAAAFVGPGDATVAGRYTTTISPVGDGNADIVALQPR